MRRRLAWLAVMSVFSGQAHAISLQAATGNVVLGQALRVTIPFESDPGKPLDARCFRVQAPAVVSDPDYVPRDATVHVESVNGKSQLVVSSRRAWIHPVIEFRISAVCGGMDLVRDYTLLADLPADPLPTVRVTPPQPVAVDPVVKLTPAPVPAPSPAPAATKGNTGGNTGSLVLDASTSLNALARLRYPEDRELRDTYRRMMAESNPELFSGKSLIGSIPLEAGTALRIPQNLPPPTTAPTPAPSPPAAAPKLPKLAETVKPEVKSERPAAKNDRLVIGGNPGNAPKPGSELAATMDRLERMSEDQGRTQVKISDNLDALEKAMAALAKNLLQMEDRMQKLSEERDKAEEARLMALAKLAEERSNFGFLEMLMLILAGGGVGAGLLFYYDRLRTRRWQEEPGLQSPEPMPVADQETISLDGTPFAHLATEMAGNAHFADFVANSHVNLTQAPVHQPPVRPEPTPEPSPAVENPPAKKMGVTTAASVAALAPEIPEIPAETVDVIDNVIEFSIDQGTVGKREEDAWAPPQQGLRLPEIDVQFAPVFPEVAPAAVSDSEEDPLVIDLDLDEPQTLPAPAVPVQVAPAPAVLEIEDMKQVSPKVGAASPAAGTAQAKGSPAEVAKELAEVMASMGFSKGAAEVLIEVINENPNDGTDLWLRFLDYYHTEGLHEEMADVMTEMKAHFNVDVSAWQDARLNTASLLDYRHVVESLVKIWNTDGCDAFLMMLLADTRGGTRVGFPRSVIEEILLLQQITRDKALH